MFHIFCHVGNRFHLFHLTICYVWMTAVALSSIKFVGCHFENNTSERSGGAFSSQVENEPSVLEDCTFKRNTASTGNGGAVEIPKGVR